ncbi:Protein kri1 [Pseudocercospora fuligena]|uniref:Protein kri1 n=1 Tax=Pseudocercospora fuligena TaxID=685502 RepID=A0A8H6RR48_9PEZI|nr:Protein kri1 [Pseudocercospora fuligena]
MAGTELRPAKKARLDFSDSESDAGVQLPPSEGFKINEEYAKRFEHNKKREERHRLEEKYGNDDAKKRKRSGEEDDESDESSTDESEDDDAELATADVDDEIMATLQMIRNKDPKRLDQNVKFYKEFDADNTAVKKEDKPMTLQDYQREKLLAGHAGQDEDGDEPMQTYAEEQEQLKRELVGSMHAAAEDDSEESNGDDDFMVKKKKSRHEDMPGVPAQRQAQKQLTDQDIASADKDPETYLSNFMAARAWLPGKGSRFQPLESDDSDDDKRAEEFEEAYNMRFEDPAKSNEKLQSFARDSGKHGVRREEKSGRARQREREREQREAEKREREEEKARLRKLKVEEAEEKVKRIKEAAGLRGQELKLDEWRDIIEGDFDDDQWETEMKRRFGEDYYAEGEDSGSEDDGGESKKRKPRKPKFEDDIDITDLVPDFDPGEKPDITLTDDEDEDGGAPLPPSDEEERHLASGKKKTKKDRLKEKSYAKRVARKERMAIEELVDASLPLQHPSLALGSSSKAPVTGFRYRETSPTSFGLSARDILFADDTALNSFAGLKKMAAFRDEQKKSRDKKKFSKKARLRQWRKETFGNADEPTGGFEKVLGTVEEEDDSRKKHKKKVEDDNIVEGKRKRKRSKKKA